ncbi:NF038129 family PEP-CTERM protein [Sulfurirhabdus autotrophica]|uniref:Secreted protein with PEP-CTERM sorting signal n=1 Tax=Sulfurirhabdus autotrophica TaxID=1706046 RepID=A0A4R3XRC3_9PROT|nr:NF038129 family PEP-CTERM protein [Sulfurirhabdus autotrophica]TCV79024.1 hypothetical protein EDC63_13712 [Sulfurirhabdus autotrophica]
MFRKNLIAGLLAFFASTAVLADTWYNTVDTSLLAGQTGWLDFQFNPGDVDAPSATATVAAFTTNGSIVGLPTLTGDVSGNLNNGITLANSQYFNDLLQGFSFGSTLSFSLDWVMPAPTPGASGTAFSLSFYDANFNSLLADPVWGSALITNLKGDGTMEVLAKSDPVSVSTTAPTPVPLPGSWGFLLAGISMFAGIRRTFFATKIKFTC